jgi:hypothetical protein
MSAPPTPRYIVTVTRRLERHERPPKGRRQEPEVLEYGIVRSFSADGQSVILTHPPKLWFEAAFHIEFLRGEAARRGKAIDIRVVEWMGEDAA